MSRGLKVRLPLLLAAGLGVWLWQSDLFAQPRELVFVLPSSAARVDVQLYSEGGELLAREERADAPSVVRMEISLRRGRYLVRAFLRGGEGGERALSREVEIGSERVNEVELR